MGVHFADEKRDGQQHRSFPAVKNESSVPPNDAISYYSGDYGGIGKKDAGVSSKH